MERKKYPLGTPGRTAGEISERDAEKTQNRIKEKELYLF